MRAGGRVLSARRVALGLVVAVAALIPFFASPTTNSQLTLVLVYSVAILGLSLLTGYGGQISLAQGAFFALGAYVAAILITDVGVPALVTIAASGVAAYAVGYVIGMPVQRLRGLYLALVTLGLAVAAGPLIRRFSDVTGGSGGLSASQPHAPEWLGLADDQLIYFIALVPAVLCLAAAGRLMRGSAGRAVTALHENEIGAQAVGIDIGRTRTELFAWSAMLAGVAGALYVFAIGFVAPESFPVMLSLTFLAALVVGGLGTIAGAVVGAFFIEYVPIYAADIDEALVGAIYGGLLILVMLVAPRGAVGLAHQLVARMRGRRAVAPTANKTQSASRQIEGGERA